MEKLGVVTDPTRESQKEGEKRAAAQSPKRNVPWTEEEGTKPFEKKPPPKTP